MTAGSNWKAKPWLLDEAQQLFRAPSVSGQGDRDTGSVWCVETGSVPSSGLVLARLRRTRPVAERRPWRGAGRATASAGVSAYRSHLGKLGEDYS